MNQRCKCCSANRLVGLFEAPMVAQVPTRDMSSVGEWLIALGSVWFILALIWPPLLILSSYFKLSGMVVRLIWPIEFAASATMAASTILLRRRTNAKAIARRLRRRDCGRVRFGSCSLTAIRLDTSLTFEI
jgi:hypothetical protein